MVSTIWCDTLTVGKKKKYIFVSLSGISQLNVLFVEGFPQCPRSEKEI